MIPPAVKNSNLGRRPRTLRPVSAMASVTALVVALLLAVAGGPVAANPSVDDVVVANRGSGDVSVIDGHDLSVTTYDLPGEAEPMYVSHDRKYGLVWVGDRASDMVVAFDDATFDVVASVPVGQGVFHQWLDESRDQLWVVGDAAGTVTVIDTAARTAITTFSIPAHLKAAGATTHDVFVEGNHAFVSLVGLDEGIVLQYSSRTFKPTGHIVTGGDPHLFVRGGRLYVASQDAGTVSSYVPATLRPLDVAEVPTAHGIVAAGNKVYVTNIAGGGTDAVWTLDRDLAVSAEPVDTDAPIAHNVAVTDGGDVFVTHSGGASTSVSVIHAESGAGQLVSVGINPFGLAIIDR